MSVSCQSKLRKSSHLMSPSLVYGHNDLEPGQIQLCGGDLCQSSTKFSSAQKLHTRVYLLTYY